jgi:dTDP-4-dehydrorhamnose 3,5-epimerase
MKLDIYHDDRGKLFHINETDLVSISNKSVIRGLHFQWNPSREKFVTVIQGSILDIIVNISPSSPRYGSYKQFILSEGEQIFVPYNFAHGFKTLEENTIILYTCNTRYNKNGEGSIYPFDKELGIDWEIEQNNSILSEKDKNGITFQQYKFDPKFL